MSTYCSLIITSHSDSRLEKTVQRVLGVSGGHVVDTQTPEMVAEREELLSALGIEAPPTPRYFWCLASGEEVASADVQAHIAWVLGKVAAGRRIADIGNSGCEAHLVCFWPGSGGAGAGVLNAGVVKALAHHATELHFDVHAENDETDAVFFDLH